MLLKRNALPTKPTQNVIGFFLDKGFVIFPVRTAEIMLDRARDNVCSTQQIEKLRALLFEWNCSSHGGEFVLAVVPKKIVE